jgi:type II secretory pathway component GspD/PulD (secretin)
MFLSIKTRVCILSFSFFISGFFFCHAQELTLKIFKVKSGSLQSLYQVANDVKSAQGKISIDENTNSLIVVDYPSVLERIDSIVAQLDIPQNLVEIKVLVIDADNELFDTLGLRTGQVVLPKGQFEAIVRALSTSRQANTRVQMMVKTLSNHPAQLQVSKDEIFGATVTRFYDGTQVISPLRQSLGDFLEVLPSVNGDGTITVTIRPTSSSLGHDGAPQEKTILTQVVLRDGDTVAIGGANSTQEVTSQRAFLGIPLSKTQNASAKKVVMFLTATATP